MNRNSNWFVPRMTVAVAWAGVVLSAVVAAAQAEDEFRIWTDNTGQHRVEAALVVVRNGQVYLEKRDGKVINLPLGRLSRADQEFLKAGSAASKESPIDQVRSAVVALQLSSDGQQWHSHPGVLIYRDSKVAYVAGSASIIATPKRYGRPQPELKYRVALFPGSDRQVIVDARVLGAHRQYGIGFWQVPSAGVPAPVRIADRPRLTDGMPVTVFGLQTGRGANNEPTISLGARKGILATIFRDEAGTITDLELRGDDIAGLPHGVAVDDQFRVIGLTGKPPRPAGHTRGPVPVETGSVRAVPCVKIAEMWTPALGKVEMNAIRWGRNGVFYEFSATTVDAFGRAKDMALLVKRLDGELPQPQRVPGGWAPAAADSATVPLTIATPDAAQAAPQTGRFPAFRPPADGEPSGTWEDPESFERGETLRYLIQLKTTDREGNTCFSAPKEILPKFYLDHFGRGQQSVSIESIFRAKGQPHPDGGLLMTWEPLYAEIPVEALATRPPEAPRPETDTGPSLIQPYRNVGGSSSSPVTEPTGAWSQDGAWFYQFTPETSVVRRLSVPELKPSVKIDFGSKVLAIGVSKEGVVVLTDGASTRQRLWVLREETLEVLRHCEVRGAMLACSRALSTAYLSGRGSFSVVDLAKGAVVHQIEPRSSDPPLGDVLVTADGRYLFGRYRFSRDVICRFRLEGTDIVLDQATAGIDAKERSLQLSGDGKFLVVAVDTSRLEVPDHPQLSRGVYVYSTSDLSAPKIGFQSEQHGFRNLMVTPGARLVLVLGSSYRKSVVNVYGADGALLDRPPLPLPADRFFLHPDGRRVLLRLGKHFAWFDIPSAGGSGGVAAATSDDSAESQRRLMNILEWEVEEVNRKLAVEWNEIPGTGRAAIARVHADPNDIRDALEAKTRNTPRPSTPDQFRAFANKMQASVGDGLPAVGATADWCWSADGRYLYVLAELMPSLVRLDTKDFTVTHRLNAERATPMGGLQRKKLGICREGLLLVCGRRLVLADADTLRPTRVICEDLPSGADFEAARERSQVILKSHRDADLSVVDVATGEVLSRWSRPSGAAGPQRIRLAETALTPDGRHLFIGGAPVIHCKIDAAGRIQRQTIPESMTSLDLRPVATNTSDTMSFISRDRSVPPFLCEIENLGKPIVNCQTTPATFYKDAATGTYFAVGRLGFLISCDRTGKEHYRLERDGLEKLGIIDLFEHTTMPPGGGSLLVRGPGQGDLNWIQLPGRED